MSAILQQRSISTTTVDLCCSMDLIAFVCDGVLAVHRTISWEKIFERKCSEVCSDASIVCVKFSLNGRYLAVGFQSGDIRLVDLENNYVSGHVAQRNRNNSEILKMCWVDSLDNSIAQMNSPLYLANGRDNLFDQDTKDEKLSFYHRLISGLNNSMLLALTISGDIILLAYGSYLIFTSNVTNNIALSTNNLIQFKVFSTNNDISVLIEWKPSHDAEMISTIYDLPSSIALNWPAWERAAFLHLMMEHLLRKLDDAVINLGKKWKECNKMIPAKVSLLQGLLTGYEMKLSPIQFYHTVTLCGLWHPSAVTSFSSHWNDQGISRFRASLLSTCKYVLRNLQFKIIPLLINLYLIASEYQNILMNNFPETGDYQWFIHEIVLIIFITEASATSKNSWKQMEMHIIYALLAAENALFEGKYTRETMLLYVQFVKDCFLEASQQGTDAPMGKYSGPDLELRQKCQLLFQPRDDRPVISNPEYITGTHLFAHFQEYSLKNGENNIGLNISRLQYVLNQDRSSKTMHSDELMNAQHKLEDLLNLISKDTFREMNVDISKPLYLFNQTKKLSSTYNQLSASMMLNCTDSKLQRRSYLQLRNCDLFDSGVITVPLTIQLVDETEVVLSKSSVRLMHTTAEASNHLCVTIHDLGKGAAGSAVYGAKVSLLFPKVHQIFLYDRVVSRANLTLTTASTPNTLANHHETSACSLLAFYYNDQSSACEIRKYSISELKFCPMDGDIGVNGGNLNKIENSLVPVVTSDLCFIQTAKISRKLCCVNPPRGVVLVADEDGKFVILDAETIEEDEEEDDNESDDSSNGD